MIKKLKIEMVSRDPQVFQAKKTGNIQVARVKGPNIYVSVTTFKCL